MLGLSVEKHSLIVDLQINWTQVDKSFNEYRIFHNCLKNNLVRHTNHCSHLGFVK